MAISRSFPDHNQNFWQLACIQSSAQSVSTLLVGGILSKKYGASIGFTSICVGNLILWIIGLAMVSMSAREKTHAIQNVRGYLGNTSGILMVMLLFLVFLTWYILGIEKTIETLDPLFQNNSIWNMIGNYRLGAVIGLLTTLIAIGGIRVIKWTCVYLFPLLLLTVIYILIATGSKIVFPGAWGFSFPAIVFVTTVFLPGFINLPTFFRHSRSRKDSFLAITLITVFDIFFECLTLFNGVSDSSEFFLIDSPFAQNSLILTLTAALVFLIIICNNLINIYFASAGVETLTPRACGAKEYAIIGLIGTTAFVFLQISAPMEFLTQFAYNSLSSLGIILLAVFLLRLIVKHRPRPNEKLIGGICWGIGCIFALLSQIQTPGSPETACIVGINASLISFLGIVFVEETIWAFRKIYFVKR